MEQVKIDQNIMNVVLAIYERNSGKLKFNGRSKEDFFIWQKAARKKLIQLLGMNEYKKVPLKIKREVIIETEDFIKERIKYYTSENVSVSAYLLIPRKVALPVPAIICPPGHGGGMNQLLDEVISNTSGQPGIYKQYPMKLVKSGFVVMVPENIGFGERGGEKVSKMELLKRGFIANIPENIGFSQGGQDKVSDDEYLCGLSHQYLYLALNLLGKSQMGMMIWELMRAIDVLQSVQEVKKDKIGCYGLSLGGELTMLLSAVDKRVSVACISGFFSSYKSSFLADLNCGCGYSYELAKYFEHIDIASMIIPRSLLIESANQDDCFPIEEASKFYKLLARSYSLCGASNNIAHDVFKGGHEISGALAYNWFVKKLK